MISNHESGLTVVKPDAAERFAAWCLPFAVLAIPLMFTVFGFLDEEVSLRNPGYCVFLLALWAGAIFSFPRLFTYYRSESALTGHIEFDKDMIRRVKPSGEVVEAKWKDLRVGSSLSPDNGLSLTFSDGTKFRILSDDPFSVATGVRFTHATRRGRVMHFDPQPEKYSSVPVRRTFILRALRPEAVPPPYEAQKDVQGAQGGWFLGFSVILFGISFFLRYKALPPTIAAPKTLTVVVAGGLVTTLTLLVVIGGQVRRIRDGDSSVRRLAVLFVLVSALILAFVLVMAYIAMA